MDSDKSKVLPQGSIFRATATPLSVVQKPSHLFTLKVADYLEENDYTQTRVWYMV